MNVANMHEPDVLREMEAHRGHGDTVEYKPEVKVEGEQTEDRRHVVAFKRPYMFERKEYTEVDLSGLDALTVKDAIEVQRQLFGQQEVAASLLTETTTAFAQALATRASGKPVEFFKLMKKPFYRPVFRYVREYVMSVEKGMENNIMQLEKPCFFEGKEYREIDLSGVADLNSMQESAAENRMAREGFVVTETSFNYLYACLIASMATGIKEEFFLGLPICEAVKLKNAVNDGSFFE